MKVAIVILNWNGADDTLECLETVKKLEVDDYKLSVIVVDNASTDDSPGKLKNLDLKKAKYTFLRNKENLGFAGGMNVGIEHAKSNGADFIVILNNDVLLDEKLLFNLLETAKKYKKAALISPKVYFAEGYEFHKKRYKQKQLGRVIWYAGGEIDWDNVYASNRGVDEVDKGQYEKVMDTDFATGNCMLIRTKALDDVGLFDERYCMYLEDTDLSVRAKRVGWRVLFAPKATLWHKVARSSGIGSELNDYFLSRNRMLFGIMYAPVRAKVALIKESFKIFLSGRKWQRIGIRDFYLGRYGMGSWQS